MTHPNVVGWHVEAAPCPRKGSATARLVRACLRLSLALLVAGAALWAIPARGEEERYEPSSRGPMTRAQVRALAAEWFPAGTADYATNIAWCESRFDPGADTNPPYIGLFQIDPGLHQHRADRLFWPGASLYSATVNAAVAADILAEQGWRAWPVCSR